MRFVGFGWSGSFPRRFCITTRRDRMNIDPNKLLGIRSHVARASTIAALAHDGQTRRDGSPYYDHVRRVAIRAKKRAAEAGHPDVYQELIEVVGYLHDVLEDTNVTQLQLSDAGIPLAAREALELITHAPGQGYNRYIARLSTHNVARAVKIADLLDNLTDNSNPRQIERYSAALNFLIKVELGQ